MGLIQRAIEQAGISTVGVSIVRRFTEQVRPPRTVFVKWPLGHPLGEPFKIEVQMAVIRDAFSALKEIREPGMIIDLPYRWKRFGESEKR